MRSHRTRFVTTQPSQRFCAELSKRVVVLQDSFDAGHVEMASILLGRDDADAAVRQPSACIRPATGIRLRLTALVSVQAVHFEAAVRCARSLPELEVATAARVLGTAQRRVAEALELPISQVVERVAQTTAELQMMQQQQQGGV